MLFNSILQDILKNLGLNISTSIELFYRQVIAQKGLPFEMRVPTKETVKAIENSRQGKGQTFASSEELFDNLGI